MICSTNTDPHETYLSTTLWCWLLYICESYYTPTLSHPQMCIYPGANPSLEALGQWLHYGSYPAHWPTQDHLYWWCSTPLEGMWASWHLQLEIRQCLLCWHWLRPWAQVPKRWIKHFMCSGLLHSNTKVWCSVESIYNSIYKSSNEELTCQAKQTNKKNSSIEIGLTPLQLASFKVAEHMEFRSFLALWVIGYARIFESIQVVFSSEMLNFLQDAGKASFTLCPTPSTHQINSHWVAMGKNRRLVLASNQCLAANTCYNCHVVYMKLIKPIKLWRPVYPTHNKNILLTNRISVIYIVRCWCCLQLVKYILIQQYHM